MKGYIVELPGQKACPYLYTLLGGTFHQDVHMYGDMLEEIITSFRSETPPEIWRETRTDIERFIAERPDDEQLVDDLERMFKPDVIIDGWDGMTARQWLTRVAQLLE